MRSRACRRSIRCWGRCGRRICGCRSIPRRTTCLRRSPGAAPCSPSKRNLRWWHAELEQQNKLIEAQRLWQRTMFDLEMIKQIGYCHGIENYSRHFSGRMPGEAPPTLLDYLPHDAIMFIDESHQTVPQLQGMYHGDRSRKDVLVNYGFRLPSARDNRPLTFEEFEHRVNQVVYVSATPGPYELTKSAGVVVEQIIRPTGLTDPEIEIRPIKGQVDDLLHEIRERAERNERVLVTTLTKRMAEDLAEYYSEVGVRCAYMHSEVSTLDRVKILRDLRRGNYDVLIGVNLLREGLDLAGSFAGRDSGCRQRRISAVDGLADSDDRPRRAQPERPRDSLCRRDDGQYEARDRRNDATPRRSGRSTTKRTTSRRNRSSSRWIWPWSRSPKPTTSPCLRAGNSGGGTDRRTAGADAERARSAA